MTNREKITELIETNFPDILVHWEQVGTIVTKNKSGIELDRRPALGNHLHIFRPNSSLLGATRWLDDEYKAD